MASKILKNAPKPKPVKRPKKKVSNTKDLLLLLNCIASMEGNVKEMIVNI